MPHQRHEYALAFADSQVPEANALPPGFAMRAVEPADLSRLAELMLDAYRNTIDYEGEGPAEAVEEIRRYLSPDSEDPPLPDCSVLVCSGATIQCACLVRQWQRRRCPLVAHVMTHPGWKRRGLAGWALAEALRRVRETGFDQVRAVITEGNVASERLFRRAGFRRVARS
jgi:RimJ/RimL family protein N-acetyltransferase